MAALGVSDYAGVHGGLDPPAPLQISHRILVQVTGQHCGETRTHPPGRKLQSTLSRHKADSEGKVIERRRDAEQRHLSSAFHTHHRGVRLRNIFIPKRGPWVSPAPSSTCAHTHTHKRFQTLGRCRCCVTHQQTAQQSDLSPAVSWRDSSQGQVNGATSVSVVSRQGTRQNSRVCSGEGSLKWHKRDFQSLHEPHSKKTNQEIKMKAN